jgi:aspartokinase/homoserine dehydrogenase 1
VRSADTATAVDRRSAKSSSSSSSDGLIALDVETRSGDHRGVGEGMKGRPDVAGKVFEALGRQNINISAIAQGASERNISCVVDASQQVARAQRDPSGVFRDRKLLALVIVGVGNVGGACCGSCEQQRIC